MKRIVCLDLCKQNVSFQEYRKDSLIQELCFMLLFHPHSQVQKSLAQCYINDRYLLNVLPFNSEIYQTLQRIKSFTIIML